MKNEMKNRYEHFNIEKKWYKEWEDKGYFHQEVDINKTPFSIVMPPPNVTGQLHLGHALDNTLQDILVRYKRMKGYNVLWVPGTDHAGIATQARVEEELRKNNSPGKYELGREKFLEKVWEWKDEYHHRITNQLRLIGSSCDWERERFTLDEGCSKAVKKVFVDLLNKDLIYRGKYIVNWCPTCSTTISDIEVEYADQDSFLWYIQYKIVDSNDYITVATTRPETILGDMGIAVSKDDSKYSHLVGKKAIVPIIGREIPIFTDRHVEAGFGTGAVKITPSHDPNDFEVANRHNLEHLVVIGKDGKMVNADKYSGLDRYECRDKIIEDLKEIGALEKILEHTHSVGECYRCGTTIEPVISNQWFVKMEPLAKRALEEVKRGESKFIPERFTKVYESWLLNIRDWCISRQLWWGHRIPVWHCSDCGKMNGSIENSVDKCSYCGSENILQDEDVLDTWFSSALWPFSTLGWPEKTLELEHFYPTSVLVTGRDIIFFWVARMLFMGLEFMDKVPFKEIFIHGLIMDKDGRKMSKSLGNGIDPIEIIDVYGADVLRFMLVTGNTPGNDIKFNVDRLETIRNFTNKIWNASRFLVMNINSEKITKPENLKLKIEDKWILNKFEETLKSIEKSMSKFNLGDAADLIYQFTWNNFCDWYIEIAKIRLYSSDESQKNTVKWILSSVLKSILKLLHPFMPFITEEIWQFVRDDEVSIMISDMPLINKDNEFIKESDEMEDIMELVRAVRNLRSENKIPLGSGVEIFIYADEIFNSLALKAREYLQALCKVDKVNIKKIGEEKIENGAFAISRKFEIALSLEGIFNKEDEIIRLKKELIKLEDEVLRIEKKLSNDQFIKKAPKNVINGEKEKLSMYLDNKKIISERLKELK